MWTVDIQIGNIENEEFSSPHWDEIAAVASSITASFVDSGNISEKEFEEGMEWLTGVVVEDHDVRVPAHFGDLTIALTLTD